MKRQKIKNNLNRRFSLVTIGTFCLCILFSSIVQFTFMDDIYLYAAQRSMMNVAEEISAVDFTDEGYKNILADFEANRNIYIEIYSPRDVLFYTTESNEAIYEPDSEEDNVQLKPRIMKIISRNELSDGDYFELRQEHYTTAEYIVYGTFFGENNGIEIYRSIDVIRENASTASWVLFALSCALTAIVLLVTLFYVFSITKPLNIINKKTEKIINMDFSETCPSFKIRDLDELSTNINTLSASLSNALNELKSENIQLEKDIERERRVEKIMRSFMANVSHELKTPISIIQGYAEGMKLGIGCDSTEESCDIIIEESVKMNNLVCRLMEYLQYGAETYKTNRSTFNISKLIEDCLNMLIHKIKGADATVTVDIDKNFYGYGDTELLSNVFNNYLSNALSHLDFERNIIIKAEDKIDRYTVSVFNSGKQIPGTDIENIWQSFYRADKAHSRAEGRFGLGLSIVAMIQRLHDQKYGVINREKGVEFWFDIKKTEPHI